MEAKHYHLIVYCPAASAEAIRLAAGEAGAGKIGSYDSCSFSSPGKGRFRPLKEASPHQGTIGELNVVEEERLEMIVTQKDLKSVVAAITKAHPYEEPALHLLPLLDYHTLL